MKKIILKIIQKVAKEYNTDISEFFAVFMAGIALNKDFENVIKSYNLQEKEKEILKEFYEYLQNELIDEKDTFIKNFIKVTDFDRVFKNLALYFSAFIPEDVLISKNSEKIKKSLNIYPEEIKEAVIKSLEMLSLGDIKIDEDLKINILKEVLNTIIILTFIIRNLNA